MKCVTEYMMWYDWASIAIIYALGVWKMIELINGVGKNVERWIHRQ